MFKQLKFKKKKTKIYYTKTTAASVLHSYFPTVVMMQVAEHTVCSIKV